MPPPGIVLRADSSPGVGGGHLLRCLALSQACASLAIPCTLLTERASLEKATFESGAIDLIGIDTAPSVMADIRETIAIARQRDATWIVLDGYEFGAEAYRAVRESGLRLLVIDDNGSTAHFACDAVVNPNVHAHERLYASRDAETVLLLGPAYALLRPEFRRWRSWTREDRPEARCVLVTLGAGASTDALRRLVQQLQDSALPAMKIRVVVGPFSDAVAGSLANDDPHHSDVEWLRSPSDMPALMAWADIAVASAGGTAQELAFMGVPAVLLVVADNQSALAAALDAAGVATSLATQGLIAAGPLADSVRNLLMDGARRREMSRCGRALFDGAGAERVAGFLAGARSQRGQL